MRLRFVLPTAFAALLMGVAVPTAYAASVQSSYSKVAGGSESCTMVQASVNNDNEKAGGRTRNFKGCSSSNAVKDMPAGYLGVSAYLAKSGSSTLCGGGGPLYTTQTSYSISVTAARDSRDCNAKGTFRGQANGYRYSGGSYILGQVNSPWQNW